ncbi:hypothetical protein [Sutcliffiella horikoshii]|nr:hypothetical protein [Sutcliffiella horikoshii]
MKLYLRFLISILIIFVCIGCEKEAEKIDFQNEINEVEKYLGLGNGRKLE